MEFDPLKQNPFRGIVCPPFHPPTPSMEETRVRLYEAVRKAEEADKAKKEE